MRGLRHEPPDSNLTRGEERQLVGVRLDEQHPVEVVAEPELAPMPQGRWNQVGPTVPCGDSRKEREILLLLEEALGRIQERLGGRAIRRRRWRYLQFSLLPSVENPQIAKSASPHSPVFAVGASMTIVAFSGMAPVHLERA